MSDESEFAGEDEYTEKFEDLQAVTRQLRDLQSHPGFKRFLKQLHDDRARKSIEISKPPTDAVDSLRREFLAGELWALGKISTRVEQEIKSNEFAMNQITASRETDDED